MLGAARGARLPMHPARAYGASYFRIKGSVASLGINPCTFEAALRVGGRVIREQLAAAAYSRPLRSQTAGVAIHPSPFDPLLILHRNRGTFSDITKLRFLVLRSRISGATTHPDPLGFTACVSSTEIAARQRPDAAAVPCAGRGRPHGGEEPLCRPHVHPGHAAPALARGCRVRQQQGKVLPW